MRRVVGLLVALAGCGRVGFDPRGGDGGLDPDAGPDGGGDPVPLGPFGPWQTPVRQTVLNSNSQEYGPTLSADGLEVIYSTRQTGNANMWRSTRLARTAVFGAPDEIFALNGPDEDGEPTLSRDGTTLVFERSAVQTTLYSATRSGATWINVTAFPPAFDGFTGADFGPGDLSLVIRSDTELFETNRNTLQASWETPTSLGITFPAGGGFPSMRSDGLEIYWEESVATGMPPAIYRATRASRDDAFGTSEMVLLGGVFDTAGRGDPDLSEDGEVMVFVSNAVGGLGLYDVYVTTRDPL